MAFNKATDFISPHQKEAIKQYLTYDGMGRMEIVYTAMADARNGDKCIKTEYAYDGSSGRVIKMKESLDNWDGTWDL